MSKRIAALDGLRAIAAIAVFACHASYGHLPGGFVGVDVFFVLSGYLITGVLRRPGATLGAFYARRLQRLYPALVVTVLLAGLLDRFGAAWHPLPPLLYVANFVGFFGVPLGSLGHTWSLAMEEQFYLAWPLVLGILTQRRNPWAYALAGAAAFAGLRWALQTSYGSPVSHLDMVLVGCALALAPTMPRAPWLAWSAAAALPVALVTLHAESVELYHRVEWAYPLLAVGTAAIISECIVSTSNMARALSWRPLVWVGERSYSFYLLHNVVLQHGLFESLRRHGSGNMAGIIAVRFGVSLVLAAICYRFVERPFLATRVPVKRAAEPNLGTTGY